MKSNKQTYNYAKSFLGKGGETFRSYCGLPSGAAWCNAYVTYIFHKTDNAKLYCNGKKQTYCPTSMKLCAKDMAQIPMYLAMPMDVIYFDWDRNGVPNHIGFVRGRKSTSEIYTIEGNTSGKVMNKTRPAKYVCAIYRPHFAPTGLKKKKLNADSDIFEYASIYNLQLALGMKPTGILTKETVKYLQRAAGTTPDGAWGKGTSKAVQRMTGLKVIDGAFGTNSVKALKRWINKKNGYGTTKPAPAKKTTPKKEATKPEKAVAWARKIAKDGGYTYKHWKNKDKKTKLCPICHKLKGKYKGWNCIGFVSAAWYHGAGLKTITCSCSGIGTDNFFTKVSENSWRKRNGKDWNMISVGSKGGKDIPADKLELGDILVCYDSKGKFHHVVLYTGNGKYIDCTNTSKKHIAERKYSNLCKRYHVTRAFRYTGK